MPNLFRPLVRLLNRGLFLLAVAGILVGTPYALYLDQVVHSQFEGKRWSLPARVYARPLELYVGRTLRPDSLQEELDRLGYGKMARPQRAGSYARQGGRFLMRTRPFRFWDGEEPSRYLELRFDGKAVVSLKEADSGHDLPLARLDSALIANIYPTDQEDRILVRRSELPPLLVQTLLAVEDRQFYSHYGLNFLAILRALWSNLRAGHVVQGGSTLTQQLIKNFYLSNERSLSRKLIEAGMALALELRYDKDQILEAYANEIYLGQDGPRAIHGFGLASHFFFNRELSDLDLPSIALLVGMIKGPSYYDPRRHPERARTRRDLVLDTLVEQGLISTTQAAEAKHAGLGVSARGGRPVGRYPAFMNLVRSQLQRDYREEDLRSEGLSIFTTLDPLVQANAEKGIAKRLPLLERSPRSDDLEAAAVVASSDNGEILALVGGRDSGYAGFNRALEAVRSIGSLVKPVIYLEALSRGYTLTTRLQDASVVLKGRAGKLWRPANYDGRTHGQVPLYQALVHSYNLATVHLGLDVGLPAVVARLRAFGVQRPIPEGAALLLGALSLTPLEVAQVYQGIASGGFLAPLRAVREVLDASGRPLRRYPLEVKEVADPRVVWLLTWAMRQVVEQGTARGLSRQLPRGLQVAGKTGTTDDYRDSWFAGFTGDKVAVVWVGRDDNRPAGLSGARGAMRVWGDIIGACDNHSWDVPPPAGIQTQWVDQTGGLAAVNCADARQVPFLAGTAPTSRGSCGRGEDPDLDLSYIQRLSQ
jgi:penicillin-binding protein 1B